MGLGQKNIYKSNRFDMIRWTYTKHKPFTELRANQFWWIFFQYVLIFDFFNVTLARKEPNTTLLLFIPNLKNCLALFGLS